VENISSVFVTAEPAADGKQPSLQKILYAYLGEPNHPYKRPQGRGPISLCASVST